MVQNHQPIPLHPRLHQLGSGWKCLLLTTRSGFCGAHPLRWRYPNRSKQSPAASYDKISTSCAVLAVRYRQGSSPLKLAGNLRSWPRLAMYYSGPIHSTKACEIQILGFEPCFDSDGFRDASLNNRLSHHSYRERTLCSVSLCKRG